LTPAQAHNKALSDKFDLQAATGKILANARRNLDQFKPKPKK
jgi:hypothetical protein